MISMKVCPAIIKLVSFLHISNTCRRYFHLLQQTKMYVGDTSATTTKTTIENIAATTTKKITRRRYLQLPQPTQINLEDNTPATTTTKH